MKEINYKTYLLHSKTQSFKKKEEKTLFLIEKSLQVLKNPYIMFSGGKDSTVMLHLISRINKDIHTVTEYNNMDWDFKEEDCNKIISFFEIKNYFCLYSKDIKENLIKTGKLFWFDVVIEYIQKYSPDGVFIGIRADENKKTRGFSIRKNGLVHQYKDNIHNRKFWTSNMIRITPMGWWSGKDIFAYLVKYKLPYSRIYDNDKFCMPHQLRFGGVYHKDEIELAVLWTKFYYPDIWNNLRTDFKRLNNA